MKKIEPPVMDDNWELHGVSFCHARKISDEKFVIEYFDTIRRNCFGTSNFYVNKNKDQLACAEYNIFDQGVVLKLWGFAEDFNKHSAPLAMFYQGTWYLKEDSDSFDFDDVDFSENEEVEGVTLLLHNNYEKKEITIKPKTL